jgi:hypothetical protein
MRVLTLASSSDRSRQLVKLMQDSFSDQLVVDSSNAVFEAQHMLRSNPYGLFVCDFILPVSGTTFFSPIQSLDFIHRLKRLSKIPCLVLSCPDPRYAEALQRVQAAFVYPVGQAEDPASFARFVAPIVGLPIQIDSLAGSLRLDTPLTEACLQDSEGGILWTQGCLDPELRGDLADFLRSKSRALSVALELPALKSWKANVQDSKYYLWQQGRQTLFGAFKEDAPTLDLGCLKTFLDQHQHA